MNYLNELEAYRERELEAYKKLNLETVNAFINILEKARLSGKRIFICGNGGSAATASHYCCDFNKGVSEKQGVKYNFECLNDNVPTILAIANDIGYEEVFRVALKNKMKPGDILVGVSGSGNSKNIINAMKYAKEIGGTTIAIVGYNGGKMKKIADYNIHIDINDMQISEDIHMVIDHMMMYALAHKGAQV